MKRVLLWFYSQLWNSLNSVDSQNNKLYLLNVKICSPLTKVLSFMAFLLKLKWKKIMLIQIEHKTVRLNFLFIVEFFYWHKKNISTMEVKLNEIQLIMTHSMSHKSKTNCGSSNGRRKLSHINLKDAWIDRKFKVYACLMISTRSRIVDDFFCAFDQTS